MFVSPQTGYVSESSHKRTTTLQRMRMSVCYFSSRGDSHVNDYDMSMQLKGASNGIRYTSPN